MPSRLDMNLILQDVHDLLNKRLQVGISVEGYQKTIISRAIDTVGNGTGTKDAAQDYSGAPTPHLIKPAAGEIYRISRILPEIVSTGKMSANKYGDLTALTNGIFVRKRDDSGVIVDYTDGLPIQTNADWSRVCYDVALSDFGVGQEWLHARWTFAKSGQFVRLIGDNNERLEVLFNDNLSTLVSHYFMVQGYIESDTGP